MRARFVGAGDSGLHQHAPGQNGTRTVALGHKPETSRFCPVPHFARAESPAATRSDEYLARAGRRAVDSALAMPAKRQASGVRASLALLETGLFSVRSRAYRLAATLRGIPDRCLCVDAALAAKKGLPDGPFRLQL